MFLDNSLVMDGTVVSGVLTGVAASTWIVGSTPSTNIIDMGITKPQAGGTARDMGIGSNAGATPKIFMDVSTTFTSGGAATLVAQLQGAPDNAGVPGAWTTYVESPSIALASLTVGAAPLDMDLPRPSPGAAMPRFYRMNYVVGTAVYTAGNMVAAITLTQDDMVYYAPGITVLN